MKAPHGVHDDDHQAVDVGLADGVQALVAVEIVVAVAGAETAAAVVVVDGVAVAFADVVEEVVDIVAEELADSVEEEHLELLFLDHALERE